MATGSESHDHSDADLVALAAALTRTLPSRVDAALADTLVRELARGAPVAIRELAGLAGGDLDDVTASVSRWPNVQRNTDGTVVAFRGLTLLETAHRFEVAGQHVWTWCAWDTLFLPGVLGLQARVRSVRPITRNPVRLTVDPDGIRDHEPELVVVSFPPAGFARVDDITNTFCCHVHFLVGPEGSERWRSLNQRGIVLSLDDAFDLGRRVTELG